MKYSGLYFIENPSTNIEKSLAYVNDLVQSIETSFQHVTRQAPWSLSYRLFRDTIPPGQQSQTDADGKAKPFDHTYQHMLHHSDLTKNRTYMYIHPPSGQGTIAAIPRQQQDAHASIIRNQMAALWTPRQVFTVQQGASYQSGLCTIEVGELRALREGPQSNAVNSPGVVICISTHIGEIESDEDTNPDIASQDDGTGTTADTEVDFDYAQAIIKECWRTIKGDKDFGGRAQIRDVMMTPELTTGTEQEREAAVRMWCEVLRLRGLYDTYDWPEETEGNGELDFLQMKVDQLVEKISEEKAQPTVEDEW